jgi:hypothetical protein
MHWRRRVCGVRREVAGVHLCLHKHWNLVLGHLLLGAAEAYPGLSISGYTCTAIPPGGTTADMASRGIAVSLSHSLVYAVVWASP